MNGKEMKPGDLLEQVKNKMWPQRSFHICYCEDRYGVQIRDLIANNSHMCDPQHDCVNLGHITQCYKSPGVKEEWGTDEWMYYFLIWPYKKDNENTCDSYGIQDRDSKELAKIHKLNNFPEGWELPEEDRF